MTSFTPSEAGTGKSGLRVQEDQQPGWRETTKRSSKNKELSILAGEQNAKTIGSVLEVWRYPVSSLSGESLQTASFVQSGLEGDRNYAIYEADAPQIAFPSIIKKWNVAPQVAARTSANGTIELSLDMRTWRPGDDPALLDQLETLFDTKVRLVTYGSSLGAEAAARRYSMQPIHLLSKQSLDRLKHWLPESDVDRRRFRPNLLVDLPNLPGLIPEYSLIGKEFDIGPVRLRGVMPCGRCSFTTLQQVDLPEDRNVLRTLIQRFEKNFGIYCEVVNEGEIAVGTKVYASANLVPERPIIVIGAGQAGAMTAKSLRELGAACPIQLFGEERHAPYERPPLSKGETGTTSGLRHVLSADEIEALDIELHLNQRVVAVHPESREVETQDGHRHPYEKLVIATGGNARRVPQLDRGHGRIHAIRTADDADTFHRVLKPGAQIGVLGGGWLGLEVAAVARKQGCDVTVFARQSHVCARALPQQVAQILVDRHRAEGVEFCLGEEPSFRDRPEHVEVTTRSGTRQIDHLLVAIGITPNDYLGRNAGLAVANGILTNAEGATSDPHIFAVGDVAAQRLADYPDGIRIESWHNANDQALRAARAILGMPSIPPLPPRFWSAQYDLMIQIAGLPDPAAPPLEDFDAAAGFWNFGTFAVGINAPREIHRFANWLSAAGTDRATPSAKPLSVQVAEPRGEKICLGKTTDFPEGTIRKIDDDRFGTIAVVTQEGRIFAVSDKCPHADASLSEGFTEPGRIVCPLHFAEFDLATGEPHNAPPGCRSLACFQTEVEDGKVYVRV